jgi:hypothetical protein
MIRRRCRNQRVPFDYVVEPEVPAGITFGSSSGRTECRKPQLNSPTRWMPLRATSSVSCNHVRRSSGRDRRVANSGRSGVVAHHVAVSYPAFNQLVLALAAGVQTIPLVSAEQLHEGNAKHAREFANAGKQETLDLLQNDGDALVETIRGLSDEQLSITTGIFFGGEMSLTQIIERILIGHPVSHLASIRATLAESAEAAE